MTAPLPQDDTCAGCGHRRAKHRPYDGGTLCTVCGPGERCREFVTAQVEAAAPSAAVEVIEQALHLARYHRVTRPGEAIAEALAATGLLRPDPEGTETEVEWQVTGGLHGPAPARDRLEADLFVKHLIPNGVVQSRTRTVTRSPWRDA